MRIIAFITHNADIRQMLDHLGVQAEPSNIAPASGPPLRQDCDAPVGEGIEAEPDWGLAARPAPDHEVDQRINLVERSGGDSDPLRKKRLASQSANHHNVFFINRAIFCPLSHSQPVPYSCG